MSGTTLYLSEVEARFLAAAMRYTSDSIYELGEWWNDSEGHEGNKPCEEPINLERLLEKIGDAESRVL